MMHMLRVGGAARRISMQGVDIDVIRIDLFEESQGDQQTLCCDYKFG